MAWRFGLAILVGSCLLFLVEPMCAKMVLPLLGGTPAVWNTCMVFFQMGLLLGYAYAHYVPDRLGTFRHAIVHLVALAAVAWTLPFALPDTVPTEWNPIVWLLAALTWAVGLPFVLISATTPLLQRWFAEAELARSHDPYFLYAASNLGSFAGLLSYPLLLEPSLTLAEQRWLWFGGYLVLLVLTALCFPWHAWQRDSTILAAPPQTQSIAWPRRLRWILLALVPSSLLLSITTIVTTDIAPIPLLWVIPLGIYLLTFVLAFAGSWRVPPAMVQRWVPLAVLVAVIVRLMQATDPLPAVLAIHLLVLFWLALACHSELAQDRPPPQRLTEFYLCLAIGGALGGVFNGLIAPLVFSRLTEYPLMLVLAALLSGLPALRPPTRADLAWAVGLGAATAGLILLVQTTHAISLDAGPIAVAVIFAGPLVLAYTRHARPWQFALGVSGILLASTLYHGVFGTPVERERSFFGVHLVADRDQVRRLVHGGTIHGTESLRPGERGIPRTYYSPGGPIGQLMHALAGDPRLDRVGLVGLGAGSLAAYSERGQHWTFYEIDPSVIRIARDRRLFTFLPEARGKVDVIEGDGRLQLAATDDRFGLLVLDAFGSDAIPLHLLTCQALDLYLDRLEPHGLIAFHISNNYVDLEPVLANLAAAADPPLDAFIWPDLDVSPEQRAAGRDPSIWLVMARHIDDLPLTVHNPPWRRAQPRPDLRPWTDDFSNLWHVFRWRGLGER
jgi:hypothetical protein